MDQSTTDNIVKLQFSFAETKNVPVMMREAIRVSNQLGLEGLLVERSDLKVSYGEGARIEMHILKRTIKP